MKIYEEFDLENFEVWSGAVNTKNKILSNGKEKEFKSLVEDIFTNGCTKTEMNDFLWFDNEMIFEYLGIEMEEI